ncbi:MAG: thioredoxin family protein [Tannerellaceae bacterium]
MLVHLSPERFIRYVADYREENLWKFKNKDPMLILFTNNEHIFVKGLRDIYDPLHSLYPNLRTYEVTVHEEPDIAKAYGIYTFPSTMFISATHEVHIMHGYLSVDQVTAAIGEIVER